MTSYLAAPSAFLSALKHVLVAMALIAGLITAAAHYYAILRGADKHQVERITAYGFLLGTALGVLFVALAAILES